MAENEDDEAEDEDEIDGDAATDRGEHGGVVNEHVKKE